MDQREGRPWSLVGRLQQVRKFYSKSREFLQQHTNSAASTLVFFRQVLNPVTREESSRVLALQVLERICQLIFWRFLVNQRCSGYEDALQKVNSRALSLLRRNDVPSVARYHRLLQSRLDQPTLGLLF
jgi:hypothetical protein